MIGQLDEAPAASSSSFEQWSLLNNPNNPILNLAQLNPNKFNASHTITQLAPSMSGMQWSIRVRFEKKTPIRFFENRLNGMPGQLIRALVYDRTLYIEIVAFNELCQKCDQMFSILNDNRTEYLIRNGSIKPIYSDRTSAWPNTVMSSHYEISLTAQSEIIPLAYHGEEIEDEGQEKEGENSNSGQVDLFRRKTKTPTELQIPINRDSKSNQVQFSLVDLKNSNFVKLNKLIFHSPDSAVNVFCVLDEVKELKQIVKTGKQKKNKINSLNNKN